uniref:Replication factor A C-terminal domain-containing protein n=1 Tax=Ananas comosus var. bracteatus TaxID=296719 RepID=A0A6V7P9Z1_ANACO|nr:unnamed protein product [Ananas comosus var. bracteatus]
MIFTLLKELHSVQQQTKIKIRISRMWEAKTPLLKNDILSLECLLIDEEGYSMQATIRKHDAEHFRSLIDEGSVYIVENFNLILAKNNYVAVNQKHMIQFSKWTRVLKNTKYTCKAKLVSIDTTYGWWYRACYNCKVAVKDFADTFWCEQCGKNDQSPIPWYKLDAVVGDEIATTNFMIFGKIAQELIRIPAQQLAIAANADKFVLPSVFNNIVGQTYIFQISIDSRKSIINAQSFKVTKIFIDDLDTKEKNKICTEDAQDTQEETINDQPAYTSQNDSGSKIVEDLLTQPVSSQSALDKPISQKGKRPFSYIEDIASATDEV